MHLHSQCDDFGASDVVPDFDCTPVAPDNAIAAGAASQAAPIGSIDVSCLDDSD
jgi:hypothetical protein